MRVIKQSGAIFAILILFSALVCQAEKKTVSQASASPIHAATNSNIMGSTLSPEDEAQLKDMIARHQRVRSKLSATDRATLDKLTEQVKTRLLPIPSGKNMLASTGQIINETIPGLAPSEQRALAEYCLGGIAAGDIGNKMDSKPMQEMQMSFNLQYLQLQSQMQNENRSYTAVSNIMKSKHDTVKNSISNVR